MRVRCQQGYGDRVFIYVPEEFKSIVQESVDQRIYQIYTFKSSTRSCK